MTGSDANFGSSAMPDSSAKPRIDSTMSATERLTSSGKRSTGAGPRDVAQVVEHALQRVDLAIDGARERLAVFRVVEDPHDQFAAVADVLHRVREVVNEARRHAAEHRLPLFLPHVLGELDELVGHAVERVAELLELVARGDGDAFVEPALRDGVRAAHQREDGLDERAAEEVADADGDEQREADDEDQLTGENVGDGVGFAARLLDHDGPAQRLERRGDAEHLHAGVVGVFERGRAGVALPVHEAHERLGGQIVAARDARLLVGVAVRDQLAVGCHDQRVALVADANLVDHPPHFFER